MKRRQTTAAEDSDLDLMRKRNEYLEAENALLKKVKVLGEERETHQRANGRKPSRN